MISAIRTWFEQLKPREKLIVSVGTLVVAVALIVGLGIRPLYVNSARTAERVANKEALLARLEQAAARLNPAGRGSASAIEGAGQSLVVVVDRSARNLGLGQYLTRNQPDGNTGIRLRFEDAPFDDLIAWIAEIQTRYGMTTVSANFDQTGAPGRVNCNLVLDRPGV